MLKSISTPTGLATATGVAILAATTNANVLQTGGWFTSHALHVGALSAGVFAGARVIPGAGKIGLVIIAALCAGEAYNFSATAERIVVERENGAAPLKDAMAKHSLVVAKLSNVEKSDVSSPRLAQAKADKKAADTAYDKELREGGRCATICNGLKADADKAQAEVIAALAEAQQMHQAEIEAAKADVEANPLPASATPLADRIGIPSWALDLIMAGLLSVGANGLAGTLIAFGAHSNSSEIPVSSTTGKSPVVAYNSQTDFDPVYAENVVRFFRPDNGGTDGVPKLGPGPTPRPTGLSKDQALADILNRLGSGEMIPSQDSLASDWGRTKQTVSDWMREWRRIGIVPAPVRIGKFKMTVKA